MQKLTASIKWIAIIISLFIIFVVILLALFCNDCFVPKDNNSVTQENLNPPTDLTTEYNPYVTAPIFKVTDVDNGSLPYSLELVWPETFKQFNDNWIPVINCSDEDYSLGNQSDKGLEKVSKEKFFSYLEEEISEGTMVTGLCSDVDCYELTKGCILYLNK